MNKQQQLIKIRAKRLGLLLYDARKTMHKNIPECAAVMDVSPDKYQSYEDGLEQPSLPQLEMLAFYYDIPVSHFLGNLSLEQSPAKKPQLPGERLISVRDRIISARLRLAQQQVKVSLSQLAEMTSINEADLNQYLAGANSIPLPVLEALTNALNLRMADLFDQHGPIGKWINQQKLLQQFSELPDDLKQFVTKPINQTFIKLAMHLSDMPAEKLRTIAESLLEITF